MQTMFNWKSSSKSQNRRCIGNAGCSSVEDATVVYNLCRNVDKGSVYSTSVERTSYTATKSGTAPLKSKAVDDGWDCVRKMYKKQGYDEETINILMASWRKGQLLLQKLDKRVCQ